MLVSVFCLSSELFEMFLIDKYRDFEEILRCLYNDSMVL